MWLIIWKFVSNPVTLALALGGLLFVAGDLHAHKVDRTSEAQAQVAELQREAAANQQVAEDATAREQATSQADQKLKATIKGYVDAYANDLRSCGLSDADLDRLRSLGGTVEAVPTAAPKPVRAKRAHPTRP